MKGMKRAALLLVVLLVGGLALSGCERKGSVIAVVNGEKIYEIELKNMITGLYGDKASSVTAAEKENLYESLITSKLISQDCAKRGLAVSDQDVESYIDSIVAAQGLKSKDELYKQLKDAYSYSEDFIKSLIKSSLEEQKLYAAVIAELVKEDDAAMKAAYEADPGKYKQVQVSHILIKVDDSTDDATAKAKASSLIKELDGGADFAALAKGNSDDTGTAINGGSVSGFFGADSTSLVAEFVAAAVKLNVGEYTKEPVKTEYGYHIIKATSVKSSFDDLKEAVRDSLYGEAKTTAYQGYLDALTEKADIQRNMTFEEEDASSGNGGSTYQPLK